MKMIVSRFPIIMPAVTVNAAAMGKGRPRQQ